MKLNQILKSAVVTSALTLSLPLFADHSRPSPTGWRGPIREAGRPWLDGYGTSRRTTSAVVRNAVQSNVWYFDQAQNLYWLYDASARVIWYYNPLTQTYTYAQAY